MCKSRRFGFDLVLTIPESNMIHVHTYISRKIQMEAKGPDNDKALFVDIQRDTR